MQRVAGDFRCPNASDDLWEVQSELDAVSVVTPLKVTAHASPSMEGAMQTLIVMAVFSGSMRGYTDQLMRARKLQVQMLT